VYSVDARLSVGLFRRRNSAAFFGVLIEPRDQFICGPVEGASFVIHCGRSCLRRFATTIKNVARRRSAAESLVLLFKMSANVVMAASSECVPVQSAQRRLLHSESCRGVWPTTIRCVGFAPNSGHAERRRRRLLVPIADLNPSWKKPELNALLWHSLASQRGGCQEAKAVS
jgi:hypothetical protein